VLLARVVTSAIGETREEACTGDAGAVLSDAATAGGSTAISASSLASSLRSSTGVALRVEARGGGRGADDPAAASRLLRLRELPAAAAVAALEAAISRSVAAGVDEPAAE